MKKLISLVLAIMMIGLVGLAFAEDETPALPTAQISITSMEVGDQVSLYKIIGWNTTKSDWELLVTVANEDFDTVDEIVAALADDSTTAPACMTALSAAVASQTVTPTPVGENKTYASTQEVGMYLALVATSTANVYNPMVLSVDFDRSTNPATGSGSTLPATSATGGTIVAKKQPVTLTKDVDNTDKKSDVAAGDTIPFVVNVTTPNYGTNYTDPYFVVTDTLSTGLEMTAEQQAAISVKVGEADLVAGVEGDYTIAPTANGYVITFTEAYLNRIKSNTTVTIRYTATVTKNANWHQVDEFENEVTAEFSNNPTGDHGRLTDDTHHYTFSIDAKLWGDGSGDDITKELKKISYNPTTGEVITAWETTSQNSWTSHEALSGAHFELRQGATVVRSTDSGSDGRLTFEGLDAGDYKLYETSAPAGYKFSTDGIPVNISASYNDDGLLTEYTITINNTNTSTYSVGLSSDHISTVTYKENTTPITSGIINTPGVTLPSTGGIGTTIFYIVGGLLLVGAAIVLVARRKAHE